MPTLYFPDADRPLMAAAFDALTESLTGSLRVAEQAAAEDDRYAELPDHVRDELDRVNRIRTVLKESS